ncbi:MAG: carboxypeptidase regulatory-like domain-containing protein, partial [bacterium]
RGDTLIDTVGSDALFSFPDLQPDETYRLIISKKGWSLFEQANISVQERSVEINPLLSPIPNTIWGSFTDLRGVRINGGRVELRSFDHRLNTDQTDWAGEFAFTVEAGGYVIGAVHPDGRQTSWLQNISLEEGSSVKIDLGVRANGFIKGELVDEEGAPLRIQGEISLYHLQRGEQIPIRSDALGKFSQWGLAPGEWVLNLFVPGYALATASPRFTFYGEDTLSLTLSLTRYGKALFGYVYRSTGEVLPEAHIMISGPTSRELISDQSGFWSLSHPDPGEYNIHIYRVGFLPPPDTTVILLPGDLLQVDRTLFYKPNSASGTVRKGDGTPFPQVRVSLQRGEGAEVETLLTDRFGEYEFVGLTPGDYFILPTHSGYRSLPERRIVSLAEGGTALNLDFILTRETGPAVVRGTLLHRGEGVEDAQVYLRNIETGERFIALSGVNGAFLFPSVIAPGHFRIRAVVADLAEVTSDTFYLAIGDTIDRNLNFPTGQITLQLWGEQNQPVVGRGVDVVSSGGERRFVLFTDENGRTETPDWLSSGVWSVAPRALVGNLPPAPQLVSLGEGETLNLIWHLGWQLDLARELA